MCSIKGDVSKIIDSMIDADVVVLSTPVYFYRMNARLKTVIDRSVMKWRQIKNKDFYLIATVAEVPIISLLLSKLKLIKFGFLRKYRKHSIIIIIIISAIITPTTDIFTLLLVSVPIVFLYEFSILLMKISERSLLKKI